MKLETNFRKTPPSGTRRQTHPNPHTANFRYLKTPTDVDTTPGRPYSWPSIDEPLHILSPASDEVPHPPHYIGRLCPGGARAIDDTPSSLVCGELCRAGMRLEFQLFL
jgi:hypothetical protein